MSDVTRILTAVEQGDARATAELLPIVYQELRQLAADRLKRESAGYTLQPTALVHEAFVRLIGNARHDWDGRGHFFAAAAEAMRRILIERARAKRRQKRGGAFSRVDCDLTAVPDDSKSEELIALDEALQKLASEDPLKAELVKLRYFAGLTLPEAASMLRISRATANRYWAYARVWLYCEIRGERVPDDE